MKPILVIKKRMTSNFIKTDYLVRGPSNIKLKKSAFLRGPSAYNSLLLSFFKTYQIRNHSLGYALYNQCRFWFLIWLPSPIILSSFCWPFGPFFAVIISKIPPAPSFVIVVPYNIDKLIVLYSTKFRF